MLALFINPHILLTSNDGPLFLLFNVSTYYKILFLS